MRLRETERIECVGSGDSLGIVIALAVVGEVLC